MRLTLDEAANRLLAGEVVATPTETVYGLAARVNDAAAVTRIFALKGRPQDNPLIVHVADRRELASLVSEVPADFSKLSAFWPGPLTIVFAANTASVPAAVRAGLLTVGIRMPAHDLTRALIAKTGPLVAPSANVSGKPSATLPEHVEADFGKDFPVLDGGACVRGVESTIVACRDGAWHLLRVGAITRESLEAALSQSLLLETHAAKPAAPGQKYRHYAPACVLVPVYDRADLPRLARESGLSGVLGFADSPLPKAGVLIDLGKRGDFGENLKRLYAKLRETDERGLARVLVDMDFAAEGLGATLKDRLERAAKK